MNNDQVNGAAKDIDGKIQEEVGKLKEAVRDATKP
jgi:uncharacterized protein YjbJ (UPF0337 family)